MRTPDDYARDWNVKPQSGDSRKAASGADTDSGGHSELNLPYHVDSPPSPEWGLGPEGYEPYGHDEDTCKEVDLVKQAGKDMLRDGYESGEPDGDGPVLRSRQVDGSYPQSIPSSNPHDRSDRSREFSKLEEGAHSGHDGARSSPGTQLIGSRQNLG